MTLEIEIELMKSECRSPETYKLYERHLRYFLQYAEMSPNLLIEKAKEDDLFVPKLLKRYLYKRESEGLSVSVLRYEFSAVKKFIESNIEEKELPWRIAKKSLKGRSGESVYANDTCPTKEDARKILAVMPLKHRVIVGVLFSSGVRIGAVLKLKVKHIDLSGDIGIIHIPIELDKVHRGYTTFITPQVKGWLTSWLREREESGEKIEPDSYLFPASFRGQHKTQVYNDSSFRGQYDKYLERADKKEAARALTDKQIKHPMNKFHLHTWRKYFSTSGTKAGVGSDYIEAMSGHIQGVKGKYKTFTDEELAKEYKKMIPQLDTETVFEEVDKSKLRNELIADLNIDQIVSENTELKMKVVLFEERMSKYEAFTKTFMDRTPEEEIELRKWLWVEFKKSKDLGEKEAPLDTKLKVAGIDKETYYGRTLEEEQEEGRKLINKAKKSRERGDNK